MDKEPTRKDYRASITRAAVAIHLPRYRGITLFESAAKIKLLWFSYLLQIFR